MNYKEVLKKGLLAAAQRRRLIIFFIAAHAVFLIFGMLAMNAKVPAVLELQSELMGEIQNLPYIKPLTGPLAPSLVLKILYTFGFNLTFGAFISTTLTGFTIFIPYIIAVWRSFIIGILFFAMDASPLQSLIFYGTALFEFTAYSLSSALGTDLGISLIFPGRQGVTSRREAVWIAFREGIWLYVLVAILLFIGAIWEISWLHYLGPISPETAPLS
ncbi:MAG: hypothetical protein ACE5DW_02585 [Thermodesulfobacteriota bacterium]